MNRRLALAAGATLALVACSSGRQAVTVQEGHPAAATSASAANAASSTASAATAAPNMVPWASDVKTAPPWAFRTGHIANPTTSAAAHAAAVPANAPATAKAGTVKTGPALGQDEASAIADSAFDVDVTARQFEPFAVIPRDLRSGFTPFSEVHLESPPAFCETRGAIYFAGADVEDALLTYGAAPGADPSQGQHGLTTIYKNVTLSRANNPPGAHIPVHEEVAPFGAVGPRSLADCPNDAAGNPISGVGIGQWWNAGGFSGGYTESKEAFDPTALTVTTDSTADWVGVEAGGLHIGVVETTVHILLPATKDTKQPVEPKVNYTITFENVTQSGNPLAVFGNNGFTLSGTNTPASVLVDQFNAQAQAHEQDLKALFQYGFSIVQPQVSTSSNASGTTYTIDAPSMYAQLLNPAGFHDQAGADEGFRLSNIHYVGLYNYVANASTA